MAENQPTPKHHESQKERWLKYGLNVGVAVVVVVLLAAALVYLAQRTARRIDTTASGAYSLKPQTINLIRDLQGKTKIVSLYQKATAQAGAGGTTDYATPVNDLLDEYRRKGKNIEVDAIDPVANPSKVDDLIAEVTEKYGGEVAQYKQVLEKREKTYAQIKEIASAEAAKSAALKLEEAGQDEASQNARDALLTANNLARLLQRSEDLIKRRMEEKPPGYKAAVTSVEETMSLMSRVAGQVIQVAGESKGNNQLPEPVRQALASAVPAYENIRKIADELAKQAQDVGELKLDDLRQSLRARDAILVMGPTDMRVIPFEQVWRADDQQLRQYVPGQELKPRFAGEQQITTAIHALNQPTKPKVVFVRAGGAPLAQAAAGPFGGGGPLSQVADRLRQYNFEVLEKDLSGMWAMQAQMQQMPAAPEPSDEEIKDAIWIVLAFPTGQQNPMMPPPSIGPRVSEHLKSGGSAMVIFAPQVDNMDDVMKEYGIQVRSDAVAVHEMVKTSDGRQGDAIEEALRYPFVFDIRDYGDHMITRPLRSLASWLVPTLSVKPLDSKPAGVQVTPIIPIPAEPKSWGETDLQALQELNNFKFDEGTDVAGPIFGGAVAEKELPATTQPTTAAAGNPAATKRISRLVVIASPMFAFDRYINEPDVDMLRRGLIVSRFPANLELFSNSVFWLANMESMIAISPAAMEVARIEPMSDGALKAWRLGGLLIGLPGLVVLAGAMVYFARRD